MAEDRVAREVFYRGRVQGVGFRFNAQRIAQHFDVKGFVRNLDDGRVHLLTIGRPSEVDAFLAEIQESMESNIVEAEVREVPVPEGHSSFAVRS